MGKTPREFRSLGEFPSHHEIAIEQFEQHWLEGRPRPIEDFVPEGASRLAVLAELVIAELEFRLKAGEEAALADYWDRFPELRGNRDLCVRIAREEYRLRRKRRESISPSLFAARYEQLAPELQQALSRDPLTANALRVAKRQNGCSVVAELGAKLAEIEWLAKGGMGEVWIVHDATLRRRIAMKVIQPKFERNAEALRRFMAEAEITSRLEHPGVAPIYGLGEHADGRPCYAMRFIRGESMGDAVRRFFRGEENQESWDEKRAEANATSTAEPASPTKLSLHRDNRKLVFRGLLQRFIAVCHTAAYAHSQGVIHRDLKPDNIRLGEHGETILLDWGLAKKLEDKPSTDSGSGSGLDSSFDAAKTKMGAFYGTPQFMSPEQARRDGAPLTCAADIYGLGATLYYLLTGRAPFPRDTPSKILDRVLLADFPAPRNVCKDAPRVLEAICLKAMSPSPEGRYESASELAEDLERYLADEPVTALIEPTLTRGRRWFSKHRTLAGMVVSTTIALAGFLAAWSVASSRHARDLAFKNAELRSAKIRVDQALETQTALAKELAEKNNALVNASTAAELAVKEARKQRDAANTRSQQVIGLTRSLVEMVGAAGPESLRITGASASAVESPSQISAPQYLDRVIEEVNAKFPVDDRTRGDVLAAVGQTKRSMGLFEAAAPVLEEALRIRRSHFGKEDVTAAAIEFNLAWSLLEIQGKAHDAEKAFRNVIRVRQMAKPRDEVALGLAQAGFLWSLYLQGKPESELLIALGAELGAAGVVNSISIAQVYFTLRKADTARARRDWPEADRLFGEASSAIEKIVPEGHPFLAARDFTIAGYLRDRGDMRAAEDYVLSGMKIYRERVGIHTYMADPLYHIAKYREEIGDYEEAVSLQREAYWLASLNPNTMRSFRPLTTFGLCSLYEKMGQHAPLRKLIDDELGSPQGLKGKDAQELSARRIHSLLESGEFSAVIVSLSGKPEETPHLPNIQSILCRALFEAGRFDEANAIMPIASHFRPEDYLPRSKPSIPTLLERLARGDPRPVEEIEAGTPSDPVARDRSNVVQPLRALAMRRLVEGKLDEAAANLAEAAQIAQRRMSTVDRAFVDLMVDQAILKLLAGDPPAGISETRRFLATVAQRYPKSSIISADFLHQAGIIATSAEDHTFARECLDAAIAIREKHWNETNVRVWSLLLDRIEATPDVRERRDFLRDHMRRMSNRSISGWRLAVLARELGVTELELGAPEAAERALLEAWRVFLPMFGEQHALSRATALKLAQVYETQGRANEAVEWKRRAETP